MTKGVGKLSNHVENYASRSTVHGIGYIFDRHLGLVDRGLWLVIAISSMSLAMWMITSLYTDWQGSQGVYAPGGHVFLPHAMQRVSYIVGLTAIQLAFFMGYK